MTTTPLLGILEVASAQNQKEATINDAFVRLENAGNALNSFSFTANAKTLSASEYGQSVVFAASNQSAVATLTVPLTQRLFVVQNGNTSYAITVKGATGASVSVAPSSKSLIYCNGTDCIAIGASLGDTNTWVGAQITQPVALTSATTITIDLATSNHFTLTIGHNATFANPSNIVPGQAGQIVITQDGTGGRTLAFGSYFKFSGGTAPTITAAIGSVTVLSYYVISATQIVVAATLNVS